MSRDEHRFGQGEKGPTAGRTGRRTSKKRLLIVLASLGLVVAGAGLAVWLSGPPEPDPVTVRDIPEAWLAAEDPVDDEEEIAPDDPPEEMPEAEDPPPPEDAVEVPEEPPAPAHDPLAPYSSTGTLVYTAEGRDLGREDYTLTVGPEGVALSSTGQFSVRLLVVPIRVRFTQEARLDSALRPVSYALDVRAPLGRSQTVTVEVEGGTAVATSDEEVTEVELEDGPALFLGMFSSFAVLPALVAGTPDEVIEYQVLLLGGPGSRDDAGDTTNGQAGAVSLRITALGARSVLAGDRRIRVDTYRVETAMGASLLLARDREFLGIHMGEGSEAFQAYRADYFPGGFELLP